MKSTLHRTLAAVVALGFALSLVAPVTAQSPPTGQQIVANYIKATGGVEAHKKLKTRVVVANFEMPMMGMKGKVESYQTAPDLFYTTIDLQGMGKQEQGCNNGVAWEVSMMTGPRIMEGDERAVFLRSGMIHAEVLIDELYTKVEYKGEETINERVCHKVEMHPKDGGSVETVHFDKETHLKVKSSAVVKSQMGDMLTESYMSNWKTVDGVLIAFDLKSIVGGGMMEFKIKTESIKHNQEIPADRFALPAQIKELQAKEN